ncbi:hypothetical protein M426DRAFT_19125 [Hypoxylon sp. CI-4A]|nr:hypothetical protein M426DRAFT_19125 [Hypoxylon sp. CI-4A]
MPLNLFVSMEKEHVPQDRNNKQRHYITASSIFDLVGPIISEVTRRRPVLHHRLNVANIGKNMNMPKRIPKVRKTANHCRSLHAYLPTTGSGVILQRLCLPIGTMGCVGEKERDSDGDENVLTEGALRHDLATKPPHPIIQAVERLIYVNSILALKKKQNAKGRVGAV